MNTTPKVICCGAAAPVIPIANKIPVYGAFVAPAPPAPSFWETDIEVIKSCGAINQNITVYMAPKAKQKIGLLMKKFVKMEWLAYLVGDKATNTVMDIIVPKQRVTVVKVTVDGQVDVPIMGVIHSHHDMGNKFSHTDDEFINQNHDISLCISHTGISGHVRVKTECNRYALVEASVVDAITEFDPAEFIKEVDAMITETNIFPGYYGKTIIGASIAEHREDLEDVDGFGTINPAIARKMFKSDLMAEITGYEESIRGVEIDDFYRVEFKVLIDYIRAIGNTALFEYYEDQAFKTNDNVFTEDYYRLIDEISSFCDVATEKELVALNKLALKLEKMLEVDRVKVRV